VYPAELFMGRELKMRLNNVRKLNETMKEEAATQISKHKSFEEGDDAMEGNTTRKMGIRMYKVNVKSITVRRHMNQMRSYSKKPLNERYSSSHGLENVCSMRDYFKTAPNATKDGQTSNSQVIGNDDNHAPRSQMT
jgi:hypothetical protein